MSNLLSQEEIEALLEICDEPDESIEKKLNVLQNNLIEIHNYINSYDFYKLMDDEKETYLKNSLRKLIEDIEDNAEIAKKIENENKELKDSQFDFENFRIFGLYCINQIDYDKFKKILNKINCSDELHESYIEEKWIKFKNEPLVFIMNYDEKLFSEIQKEIKKENYKG